MPIVYRSILAPIQFDDPTFNALHYAERLARESDGTLHLLHVVEKYPALGEPDVSENDNIREEETSRQRLTQIAQEQLGAVKWQVHVAAAAPRALAKAIVRVAEEVAADVIVLRTHGRKGLAHLVIGSVAEDVVRNATCPVLTVTPAALQKLVAERS
ncbi:MAG TPA: universal stress protein [Candidatus Binataceae bacterium]|jgi:nucleotide-binding universal stress UspA family protein|nr:universal stress protein [Candidatus Binataceae bacterium]